MTAEERRAERFDPRDADPLTVGYPCCAPFRSKPDDRGEYLCTLEPDHAGPHAWTSGNLVQFAVRDRETREEFRSGAVVLYLAVILAIVAGAAIAWLWWTFR